MPRSRQILPARRRFRRIIVAAGLALTALGAGAIAAGVANFSSPVTIVPSLSLSPFPPPFLGTSPQPGTPAVSYSPPAGLAPAVARDVAVSSSTFSGSLLLDVTGDGVVAGSVDQVNFKFAAWPGGGSVNTLFVSVQDSTFTDGNLADQTLTPGNDEMVEVSGLPANLTVGAYTFTVSSPSITYPSDISAVPISLLLPGASVNPATCLPIDGSGACNAYGISAASGQQITLDASGTWKFASSGLVGPAGSGGPCPGSCVDSSLPAHALIYRVNSGPWQSILSSPAFFAPTADPIVQFVMNETTGAGDFSDNSGNITVEVQVGVTPVQSISDLSVKTATWYSGAFTVDQNGDGAAAEPLEYVVSDVDSDGLFDTVQFKDAAGMLGTAYGQDDAVPAGVHSFKVTFGNAPALPDGTPALESLWYAGLFPATLDGSPASLPFLFVDENSDGVFDHLELDTDNDGLYSAGEVFASGNVAMIAGTNVGLAFDANPLLGLTLSRESTPGFPVIPDSSGPSDSLDSGSGFGEAVDDLIAGDAPSDAELAALAAIPVPAGPEAPSLEDAIETVDGQPLVPGEVVVILDPDLVEDTDLLAKRIAKAFNGEITGAIKATATYQIGIAADTVERIEATLEVVRQIPGVLYAVPHFLIEDFGVRYPNDPLVNNRLVDQPVLAAWHLEYMRLPAAWDLTTGNRAVRIGMVDSDFDPGHADLRSNVDLYDGPRSLSNGHGTHVAGTACATGNNGLGGAGTAWECSLHLSDFGGISAVMAHDALVKVVDSGARIINFSAQWVDQNMCGRVPTTATQARVKELNDTFSPAIEHAIRSGKDVLWVFPAGNECRDARFSSPASLVQRFPNNVIVVASVEPGGRLSQFSDFGGLVDIAAPGGNILSTSPRSCTPGCKDEYRTLSGTSIAAPAVSGVAALMLSVNPRMTAAQMKSCIVRTSAAGVPGHSFRGLDAFGAVMCASSLAGADSQGQRTQRQPNQPQQPAQPTRPSSPFVPTAPVTSSTGSEPANIARQPEHTGCGLSPVDPC